MTKIGKSWLLLAPLILAGCSTTSPVLGETCLSRADEYASPDRIRDGAAPEALGGRALCEGLAYLQEKKAGAARSRLEVALKRADPDQHWPIKGYLARAQALDQVGELALRNWKPAIEGAIRVKHALRETLFRADRGIYLAQHKQFDRALEDFTQAYAKADNPVIKAQMAYTAFKVTASMEKVDLMRRWYPLAMAACEAVGDGEKMAYATEYFGQVLDKQQDFAASDTIYRQGIEAVRRTGNLEALADVMEFHGQSRYAAGDREGGRESYGRSAQIYGATGHSDYADFMARNGRAKEARLQRELQED